MGAFVTPLQGPTGRLQGSVPSPPQGPSEFSRQLIATAGALDKYAEYEDKKRSAMEKSIVARRVAAANEELSTLRFDIPNDVNIHPLNRREEFNKRALSLIGRVGEGLSQEMANDATARLQAKATVLANSLDLEGTQTFVSREKESLNAEITVYQSEFVHASSPEEQEVVLSSLALSLQNRVDAGIITEAQMDALTQEFADGTNAIAVQMAINSNAEGMFDHLVDLMSGGSGVPGLPVPRDLNKAFQEVQNELREKNAFADRAEAREEKLLNKAQDASAFEVYYEALDHRRDNEYLTGLFNKVRAMKRSGALNPNDAGRLANAIVGMQDELANGEVPDNIETIQQARQIAWYDPQQAVKFVQANEGTNLKFSTVNTLQNQFRDMMQEGHILRRPEVRAAVDYIESYFGSGGMMAKFAEGNTLTRIKGQAVDEFIQRMLSLSGPRGTVVDPALKVIPDLKEQIVTSFLQRLASIPSLGASRLQPAKPIASTVPALIIQAQKMIQAGADKRQVEAWVRKDLTRLYIQQGGNPQNMAMFAAWRAEILQQIRAQQQGAK